MKRHLLYLASGFWLLVSPAFAIIDANNNGLSDLWEKAHNNDQLFPNSYDPQADSDQDGWTNAEEAAAGTDPADPNPPDGLVRPDVEHVPAVFGTPDVNGTPEIITPESVTLTWPTIPGKQYTLLISTDLTPESWLPCGQDATFIGNGNQVTYGFPTSISVKSFWRIAVTDTDTDGDGFTNSEEFQKGTSSQIADHDDDGLPDEWETTHGLSINDDGSLSADNGANGDPDGDGLLNIDEFWLFGDPHDTDTDNDGLDDFFESWISETLLSNPDSDGDNIADGDEDPDKDGLSILSEINIHFTNAIDADTDGDDLLDGWEVANGLNPLVYDVVTDPDTDGLTNIQEQNIGLNPLDDDSDNDGILDSEEDNDSDELTNIVELNIHHTNPLKADTDNDLLSDNEEINIHQTDPILHDSDNDGIPDGWEILHNLNPKNAAGNHGTVGDPDVDGLGNFVEWLNNTDPHDDDSDNDGTKDGIEVAQSSDPNFSGDGGQQPSAEELLAVPFAVSDPSESHSEKWKMTIRGLGPDDHRTIFVASPAFGEEASTILELRKENRYEISVSHLASDPAYLADHENKPDYDWEATADLKPIGMVQESFDGIPGSFNYFTIKNHWLVDNRQAVFTKIKHGNEEDLVTGHTAIFIPLPIERDEDIMNNHWQKITGKLAQALPGQKINLRINQAQLPPSITLSNFHWSLPSLVFKNYEADQQTGVLTKMVDTDTNQSIVQFYFTNAGSKIVTFQASINGQPIQLDVSLEILEPVANFTSTLSVVRLYTDRFTQIRRVGLVEDQNIVDDIYNGIQWDGDVSVPAGWPQGKWQWVQTGTPNVSVTKNNGDPLVFSTNGQTGLDTHYPASPKPYTSHPGTAGSYPTGVYDRSDTFGDSPSLPLTDYRHCSYSANFTVYMMFLPDGVESRYVPLKSMAWYMYLTAIKDLQSEVWSIPSSGQDADPPQATTIHPTWNLNIFGDFVPP